MDTDRLERIEASLHDAHQKLDAMMKLLADQKRPLTTMEDHVHNVEASISAVAGRVPFLNSFVAPSRRELTRAREDETAEAHD